MEEVQAAFEVFQPKPEEEGRGGGRQGDGWSQFDDGDDKPGKHHPSNTNVGGRTRAGERFELQWHHEQAGIIPNGCPQETSLRHGAHHRGLSNERTVGKDEDSWWEETTDGLYWQLYKSLAAFRMAERKETKEGR